MQGDATFDDRMRILLAHVPIHFLIHQPKRQRLVTDQRLIVTLSIGDGGLAETAVCEDIPQVTDVPIFVATVLEKLDPVVRNAHGEAVGKPQATIGDGTAKAGHARHVFGDGDGSRFDFLDEARGEF